VDAQVVAAISTLALALAFVAREAIKGLASRRQERRERDEERDADAPLPRMWSESGATHRLSTSADVDKERHAAIMERLKEIDRSSSARHEHLRDLLAARLTEIVAVHDRSTSILNEMIRAIRRSNHE
jgi:hypothetical protein